MIHVSTETTHQPGPILRMDCPNCNALGVEGVTYDVLQQERLLTFIPVGTTRWAEITCRSCGRVFRLKGTSADLASMTPEQLSDLVATEGMSYVSNIAKMFVVASFIIPGIGLIFALLALFATRRARSGWRTAAYVGLAVSIGLVALMFLATSSSNR